MESLKFASGPGLERLDREKRSDFETTPGKISLVTMLELDSTKVSTKPWNYLNTFTGLLFYQFQTFSAISLLELFRFKMLPFTKRKRC